VFFFDAALGALLLLDTNSCLHVVFTYRYLLDNWWNPAAEMQAIDRTHRLGQHRPIRAVRFIAEGTVEERVLQLQEKKRMVFDGTVGRDAGSLKALSVTDMKALFT
jgi:DNA repair protein RAD16